MFNKIILERLGKMINCLYVVIQKCLSAKVKIDDTPMEVDEMLYEFEEIIYADMLKRLSPMIIISH